jgi:hypothetical protein
MKITIHKVGDKFAVRQGEVELGAWTDARKAKAARGTLEGAIIAGMGPVAAAMLAIESARDPGTYEGYNDAPDEHFVELAQRPRLGDWPTS